MSQTKPDRNAFLRHAVATIAYRAGKSIRDAPSGYGNFELAPGSRTPLQILSHMGDVLSWCASIVASRQTWADTKPQTWDEEVGRFHGVLRELDAALAEGNRAELPALQLLQGPLADTLAHIGQLALLRRLAGSPVKGENYFQADIRAGRTGPEQSSSHHEFD